MAAVTEHTNEALTPADNPQNINTRLIGFALNQSKQTKNLKKDALKTTYETVVNNFNENINITCSSGFFLKVILPCFLELALQACIPDQPLVIDGINIQCTNQRASLDNSNLNVNHIYFFNLSDTGVNLATVTIHCHVTTKLVQLQGSKIVKGVKAPVWFHHNVYS